MIVKGPHFILLILGTIVTFSFVWVRLQIVSISYEINELTKQEIALREECNAYSLKINEAKSPQKLEHVAKTKFKMFPPRADQLVFLKQER